MAIMNTIKATIFFKGPFWIGIFEQVDKKGYAVARHIFGAEPSDPEIYEFVLHHFCHLKFGESREFKLQINRMNPKRAQREARREMERIKETARPSTLSQDYMREELEKKKKERKTKTTEEKQCRKVEQFNIKQMKKKEKQKGH